MPEHPHQRVAFGILRLLFEIISHYMLYCLFMMLVHMRIYTEELCWRIDMSAVYIVADECWLMPWYFTILERPAKSTWHYTNRLMMIVEAIHACACHPEYFALPQVSYYNLGFDYNYN